MKNLFLQFLDLFFLLFHTLFTLFNICGWVWKKTRKLHLLTLGLTLFSWVILGIRYGFGFCFCTEWHWQVMAKLGRYPKENGYIQFLLNRLTGLDLPESLVDRWAVIVMAGIIISTIAVNLKDLIKKNRNSS